MADAFFVAFRFPNLFRRLFGEGAFNSAFVPLFAKKLEGEGKEAARRFAEEALAGLVFVILLLTIVAELAMPLLMLGLAPGFNANPEKFDLAVLLTRITMPYLLCMSLVALLSGVLNSVGKFVESSAVSIVLNVTMMVATLIALAMGLRNEPLAGVVQAWGVFAAGLLQLWLLVDGARRNGLSLRLRWPRMSDDMRRLIKLGIPGIIAGGVTQLNIVIGTVIASLQDGAVSHLYYADRVYELPLAIVGIAIGVVLLPDVSRHLRAGNHAAVMDSQNRSLEFAMLLTVPASVALAVVPMEIVRGLFERGAFTAADTPATAYALAIFRPQEGHDHQRRLQHLSERPRDRDARARRGRRRRGGRRRFAAMGRNAGRVRRPRARQQRQRRGPAAVVQRKGRQDAAPGRAPRRRRAAAQRHRQGAEARAAPVPRGVGALIEPLLPRAPPRRRSRGGVGVTG